MQSSHCVATPIATAIRRLPRAPADPCGRIRRASTRAGYSPACPASAEIRDSARDRSCPSWASMQPASDGRSLPRRAPRRIARAEADTHPANHIARHRGGRGDASATKTIGSMRTSGRLTHVNAARRIGRSRAGTAQAKPSCDNGTEVHERASPNSMRRAPAIARKKQSSPARRLARPPPSNFEPAPPPTDCDARWPVQPRRAAANHALAAPAPHASPLVTMPARRWPHSRPHRA
ncbi:hypothetical protein X992_1235 [Burkholderia pseudomallei MSHR5492]|nr:hypothetical protein X992_1235 [Burkholderia pseudomallei MSHR5492]